MSKMNALNRKMNLKTSNSGMEVGEADNKYKPGRECQLPSIHPSIHPPKKEACGKLAGSIHPSAPRAQGAAAPQ